MGWMGPLTNRQYEVWTEWLDLQWNNPGVLEYYLMQIACQVTRSNAKNPKSVKMQNFKLEFKARNSNPQGKRQRDLQMAWSKARWAAIIGTDQPPTPPPDNSIDSEPVGVGEYAIEERVGS